MSNGPTVLIMAAGEGTRMRSSTPKVLHPVCGRPMIAWPIAAAREGGAGRVCVIVSPERDLADELPEGIETVVQPQADGTGGAIRAALEVVREAETVVVLSGDHPLVSGELVADLVRAHRETGAAATVITIELDDPGAYGRIVRDERGEIERIVETKHPENVPPEILAIGEINTGTYAFAGAPLAAALEAMTPDPGTGEYYLGDVLPLLRERGLPVIAHRTDDATINIGVNNRADLAAATAIARARILERHMLAGVTIVDPASTWIDADAELEPDVTIEPGTTVRGATRIASGAVVGPLTTVVDSELGPGARIVHSYLDRCRVGPEVSVGPFAYLRPDAALERGAKAGTFVEIKASRVGPGAKVPHLSYVGDAEVGAGANLGAGTITANYDGFAKHRTKIGEDARIGVDTALVAPVEVGDRAYTGAGTVIRSNVPPGALAVSMGKQRNIDGYADRKEAERGARDDEGAGRAG